MHANATEVRLRGSSRTTPPARIDNSLAARQGYTRHDRGISPDNISDISDNVSQQDLEPNGAHNFNVKYQTSNGIALNCRTEKD